GGQLFLKTYQEDNAAVISIKDTGTGIPEQIKQKIFDPFFTTKGERGTGLGLSLVYKIVTAHHGIIDVESEPGEGTEFIIHLPLSDDTPVQKEKEEARTPLSVEEIKLLVVDDEPELLETIAEVLSVKFQHVDIAYSGKEALEKARQQQYDLVITDLGMPEISGWEVAREVKKLQPDTKVILVTGWGMQAEEELHQHHYVDSILGKPYDLHNLLTTIEQLHSTTENPSTN
ncbi:MAG: response regulator, partial [Calditrichaeota bacterium]